jgi:3-dehydroquinate synthase
MKEITVYNKYINYRVYIDNTMDKLHSLLDEYKIKNGENIFIITDDILFNLYDKSIEKFGKGYNYCIFYMRNGEENKDINNMLKIYDFLIENNADINSVIIAFGGGIVCDMAAYAASTFMRGIRWISIPTTLISMVDSCIGGKNAFNYRGLKNIIGSFYNPVLVYISINFLKSLSDEHFINGLAEVIKYGIIKDKLLLHYISENAFQIMEKENDRLSYVIRECLNIKAGIIKDDYRDSGLRNTLNFGYTIGHSIEESTNYSVLHGNAVALGMLATIKLSEIKLGLPTDVFTNIEKLYKKLNLPTRYKVDNFASFLYAIKHDKKNNDSIGFVLLEQIEKCRVKVAVSESEIIEAVKLSISRRN